MNYKILIFSLISFINSNSSNLTKVVSCTLQKCTCSELLTQVNSRIQRLETNIANRVNQNRSALKLDDATSDKHKLEKLQRSCPNRKN